MPEITLQNIKLRRGTASEWTTADPILQEREIGLETDTHQLKIGTGAAWSATPYWGGQSTIVRQGSYYATLFNVAQAVPNVYAAGTVIEDTANNKRFVVAGDEGQFWYELGVMP